MNDYQSFDEKQKEDLKEVFNGMKLSLKESERIEGGAEAWICLTSSCNPACHTESCKNGTFKEEEICPISGYFGSYT